MDFTGAIAIIFFFTAVGVSLGGWILARHRERMAIIERGISAEDIKALYQRRSWRTSPLSSLKWGILLLTLGLGLFAGNRLMDIYQMNAGVTVSLMAMFGGMGLVVFYMIARNKVDPA